MGCDIHWLVERQHPDGAWETSMHGMETWSDIFQRTSKYRDHQDDFDDMNYEWFGVLSGVRSNTEGPYLATPGLPDDASFFARSAMDWDPQANETLDYSDFHSHGWLTLDTLIDARSDANALPILSDPAIFQMVQRRVSAFEAMLKATGPNGPQTIFQGRFNDPDQDWFHPDMENLSQHLKLKLQIRGRELGPIKGQTTRLLISYDN